MGTIIEGGRRLFGWFIERFKLFRQYPISIIFFGCFALLRFFLQRLLDFCPTMLITYTLQSTR
jgi:hypothetical protein